MIDRCKGIDGDGDGDGDVNIDADIDRDTVLNLHTAVDGFIAIDGLAETLFTTLFYPI